MTTETTTDEALRIETRHGETVVVDRDGGVWWPSEAAIALSDDLRVVCATRPMLGEWRQ